MGALTTGDIFLFEGFRFDRRGLFRRDEQGDFSPVATGSRVLLGVLLERPGALVSRDEILATVWPGMVVEHSNLTVQISALRRILDRRGASGSCIKTVAGRGYRFVAPVTRREAEAGSAPAAVSEDGARPAPRRSIVVLPFTNLSNDPDRDCIADGITDDLTTDLSWVAGSFVISRSTALTYKGKAVEATQIGRELGVRYVLEGSVRRSGDQVRVNAQLIDAKTDAHLRAERFDRNIGDLVAVEDEIIGRVAWILAAEPDEASPQTGRPKAVDPNLADTGAGYRRAEPLQKLAQPERRLLTVLSCGIAGITPWPIDLDPEEALAKIAPLHHACTEVVEMHGGLVARCDGDRLLAYFGYPRAHEGDAERAVKAALAW